MAKAKTKEKSKYKTKSKTKTKEVELAQPLVHPGITMESPLNVAIIETKNKKIVVTCDWERQNQTSKHPLVIYQANEDAPELLCSKKLEYLGQSFMLQNGLTQRFCPCAIMKQAIAHIISLNFYPKKKETIAMELRWDKKRFLFTLNHENFDCNEAQKKKIFADYLNQAIEKCKKEPVKNLMMTAKSESTGAFADYSEMTKWSKKLRKSVNEIK